MSDAGSETRRLFEEIKEDEQDKNSQRLFKDPDSRKSKAIGFVCAFISMFLHTVSVGFAQALGGCVPDFQLNLWRFIAQFLTVAPVILYKGWSIRPSRKHVPWMLLVGAAYNVSNYTYYGASIHLPAATLGGLLPSLVIIMVALLTLALTRKCQLHVAISVVLCMSGVILLTQPDFIFRDTLSGPKSARVFWYHPLCTRVRHHQNKVLLQSAMADLQNNQTIGRPKPHTTTNQSSDNTDVLIEEPTSGDLTGYIFVVIGSAAITIAYYVPSRCLTNVNSFVTLFWVSSGGILVSTVAMSIFETLTYPNTSLCVMFLCGHAASAAVATLNTQISIQTISPVVFSLAQSFQVVVLYAAQYTFLRHLGPGHRNAIEVVGVVVVFLGNIAGPLYELYRDVLRKSRRVDSDD